ncbi:hypothetical protein [Dictyobacter arantiisoli]|uniref:Uncharacterized protein n=1 Tax=Dictyobacter arantiisoli TaxID=2014874 RepID=A0A5A5T848_9CHLR|nr:hypothetical protein [Dictyobacter arantiisoli]GCF07641.1 hypothetical protein KDI_12050 [Dictyobacter arantiisoli]
MNFDDEDEYLNNTDELEETGSDNLLSDDDLRLPEDANPLVRLHAVRAWLKRQQAETKLALGVAALEIQEIEQAPETVPLRRRAQQEKQERIQRIQATFQSHQESLDAYEEASEWLEDCVNHTTVSERLLVEYYLQIEDVVRTALEDNSLQATPRIEALLNVQQRVERVAATYEED